ncbi:Pex19-domain-containing protein [Sodiomyces alkalinus F11]|uniref:Pex19-domain-containing protein n=1 Tax=Sodiomyces alkalinus (strain CBS 110278 / VKM F-3762 / F11) TaxID=1314773 RepID=A0A3N2Q3N9_SODAK|nr:Pex19-domain-containing protein [Sodiomyces alkalinus F11]ROT41245.1 Pex19-domain-containing protein [Sodiomyces alkalinus F11]
MSDTPGAKAEEEKKASAAQAQDKKPIDQVDDVPDPDEDDLDDLDDMLDEFSSVKLDAKQPVGAVDPGRPSPPEAVKGASSADQADKSLDDVLGDDEFAKQLQAGMAELIGELEKNPEMQAQFDEVFKEISNAGTGETAADDSKASASAAGPRPSTSDSNRAESSFQETIRRTMERMQASGEQATAAATESATEDLLAEMMKQLGGDGSGSGNDEDFSKMLMGMMEQLTNKEILYEPMKELDEKFPEWLEKNKDKTPVEELKRYEEQRVLVMEIVGKFDETTYSDSNSADREYIVERMQKMQDLGSPPADLVGDMPSAQEALSMPDDSCNPQ